MDQSKINWSTVRHVLWDKGPVALFMSPSAFPIGVWFYESVLPERLRSTIPGLDIAAGVVSVLAGFAIDIGIVRIATGKPTHENRWRSLTTWVPIIVWAMGCAILYDWYSQGRWDLNPSTLTHLAFPTISLAMALYWSIGHDYESLIRKPIQEQFERAQLLIKWLKAEINRLGDELNTERERAARAFTEMRDQLTAQVAQLTERLTLAEENQRRGQELIQQAANQLTDQQRQSQESFDQLNRTVVQMRQAHEAAIEQLKLAHAGEVEDLVNEALDLKRKYIQEKQLREELEERQRSAPGSGKKAIIRQILQDDPNATSDTILEALHIDKSDGKAVQSARTQISQVKNELGLTISAA